MRLFRGLLRKKQSKGYGIHSPFAYDLVTNVLYSPYSYYAFSDIPELLNEKGIYPDIITEFNHISYRLVNHFKAQNILEINSGNGVNTLFLQSPNSGIHCTCIAEEEIDATGGQTYDAIFINLKRHSNCTPSIETLLDLSNEHTFWVIYPIKSKWSKQLWRDIVKDERVRVTFDMRDKGIVFLRFSYHKLHYLV